MASSPVLMKAQKDLGLIWINPSGVSPLYLRSWIDSEGSSSFHCQAWGTFKCCLFPLITFFCMVPVFHWPDLFIETWVFPSTFLHKQV